MCHGPSRGWSPVPAPWDSMSCLPGERDTQGMKPLSRGAQTPLCQNRLEKGHRMSSCSPEGFLSCQTGRGMERLRIPDVKCRIGASRPHCSSLHELLQLLKSFKWVTPLTDQGPDLKFPFLLSQTALACTDSTVTLTFRCNCCQRDACWSHLFPRLKLGLNWWNKEKMGNSSEEVQGRENLSERARCYTENFEGK